ncbi:MAG: hypothetical protein CMJ32_03695 [Phycisphaerae bacterium]|nr:hypothetical protein [Phycisphaerae bacterium]
MPTPIIISTWSFGQKSNDQVWPDLASGGSSLDAVVKACAIADADEQIDSVGRGGMPDASGRMSLDGCIMQAPDRCGSAAAVRHHLHPVEVARLVMEHTEHVMLVGEDADVFADQHGLQREELLTEKARQAWKKWSSDRKKPDPTDAGASGRPIDQGPEDGRLFSSYLEDPSDPESRWRNHDTIGVLSIDEGGVLSGACSTSGWAFKVPGRVGDSPIIGHGLYVDPSSGGCVATGSGELVMGTCGSFLVVELMRNGKSPLEAIMEVVERIDQSHDITSKHQVAFIAIKPDGHWSAAALRKGFRAAIRDDDGSRIVDPEWVLRPD